MAVKMSYIGLSGRVWDLIGDRDHFIIESGISGLIGDARDLADVIPGRAGQRPRGIAVQPMTGSVACSIIPEDWGEFRADWSRRQAGVFQLDRGDGRGLFWCRPRLSAIPDPPSRDPGKERSEVTIPMIVDDGGWLQTHTGTGTVTVTNSGEAPLWVKIPWQGDGGRVTVPSQASFVLPPTLERRVLHLDSAESCLVTDVDGVVDRPLWEQVRQSAFPEGVPAGEQRVFTVPQGAAVEYETLHLDPWR